MTEHAPTPGGRRRVRALLLSDRIDTSNLERDGVVSTLPLTYKLGKDGLVTVFRYAPFRCATVTRMRNGAIGICLRSYSTQEFNEVSGSKCFARRDLLLLRQRRSLDRLRRRGCCLPHGAGSGVGRFCRRRQRVGAADDHGRDSEVRPCAMPGMRFARAACRVEKSRRQILPARLFAQPLWAPSDQAVSGCG
jgi:hypothetical protein